MNMQTVEKSVCPECDIQYDYMDPPGNASFTDWITMYGNDAPMMLQPCTCVVRIGDVAPLMIRCHICQQEFDEQDEFIEHWRDAHDW